jgi:hypothetical protein
MDDWENFGRIEREREREELLLGEKRKTVRMGPLLTEEIHLR